MAKPKSVGRLPLTSRQESPASSVRSTSQCFCMKSTLGRFGFMAMRCTQWPISAVGLGMYRECRPRLIGFRHAFRGRGRLTGRCPRLVPGFAAVIGALDDLPEPAAGLRGINPIRVNRRALHVIDLPATEVQAADVPFFALAVRCQDKGAFARTDQNPYCAHAVLP